MQKVGNASGEAFPELMKDLSINNELLSETNCLRIYSDNV